MAIGQITAQLVLQLACRSAGLRPIASMGSAISSGTYAKPVKAMYSASIPIIGLHHGASRNIGRIRVNPDGYNVPLALKPLLGAKGFRPGCPPLMARRIGIAEIVPHSRGGSR